MRHIWLITSASLLLMACGGGGGGEDDDGASSTINYDDQTPLGGVLGFINAVPDSPDLIIDYAGTNDDASADPEGSVQLGFGEASSFSTTRGDYEIEIYYYQPDGEKTVLAQYTEGNAIEIRQEDEIFLAIIGPLEEARALRINNTDFLYDVPTEDDDSLPVVDPELQILHTVVGEEALDFYLTDGGTSLSRATPTATLGFGEYTQVFTRDARTDYRLRVTPAGQPSTVLYDSHEFTASDSTRRMIVAFNYFGPGTSQVQAKRIGTTAETFPEEKLPNAFRFSNLVADVNAVDVYFGDTNEVPVLASIGFGEQTDYLRFDLDGNEAVSVNVTPEGIDNQFVYQGTHTLSTGVANTLLVGGLLTDAANDDDPTIAGTLAVDDNRPTSSAIQFRAFHGAASAGTVDIYLLAPGQTTADRSPQFGGFALGSHGTTTLEPGDHDLVIVDQANDGTIAGPERIVLRPGSIYSLSVMDVAGGGLPVVWRLTSEEALPE